MSTIYTVGNGERTQVAMRADGVWFMRRKWKRRWSKWDSVGKVRPFEFGLYVVPGKARLPDGAI